MGLLNIYRKFMRMDFFDYVNHINMTISKIKARTFYVFIFGKFGRDSWLKKPDLIYGAGNIFIASDVRIEKGAVLYAVKNYQAQKYTGEIKIGQGTFANRQFNATAAISIEIGEEVMFGPNVFVCDFDHEFADPSSSRIVTPLVSKGPVKIGDRCWIGANVFVGSGVTLGEGCVVGANSVVTKSFPAFTVIAGSPAVAIKKYDMQTKSWVKA